MCAHYEALRKWERYAKYFGINQPQPPVQLPQHVFPTALAPIIRRPPELTSGDEAVPVREVVIGHFGLLPGFAKDIKYGLRTYNARSETVNELASFKHAWAKARHCIVPCNAIYEPDQKYTLKTMPGKFSGMHLVSIMYAAFKQIDPTMDSGVDLQREYDAAMAMQNQ
jgi:putative SOS response-associated peptidase YedK